MRAFPRALAIGRSPRCASYSECFWARLSKRRTPAGPRHNWRTPTTTTSDTTTPSGASASAVASPNRGVPSGSRPSSVVRCATSESDLRSTASDRGLRITWRAPRDRRATSARFPRTRRRASHRLPDRGHPASASHTAGPLRPQSTQVPPQRPMAAAAVRFVVALSRLVRGLSKPGWRRSSSAFTSLTRPPARPPLTPTTFADSEQRFRQMVPRPHH